VTYRDELERAVTAAQRRYRWWPSKARSEVLRLLLEDLRKDENGLNDAEGVTLRRAIHDLQERLDRAENAIALRRIQGAERGLATSGKLA
jgi:hypothetical protein